MFHKNIIAIRVSPLWQCLHKDCTHCYSAREIRVTIRCTCLTTGKKCPAKTNRISRKSKNWRANPRISEVPAFFFLARKTHKSRYSENTRGPIRGFFPISGGTFSSTIRAACNRPTPTAGARQGQNVLLSGC